MRLYLDTSLLVAALTVEAETVRIQQWLETQSPDDIAISDWVNTEFHAAVSRKIRMNHLAVAERTEVLRVFYDVTSSFSTLTVTREHFLSAGKLAARSEMGLRAGDALHLAIAAEQSLALCTLDKKQAEAGDRLGVKTHLI